ncbi:Rqc2 family fibronectin-binding protein [Alicyclobacillus dauci]|uniref:Rqc2 homolog RqcH n=1 Tax=Alicyclobacillus dauci TaxID=1475485 RepID=A0ABY6YY12_9BACL|nr:NFACT RNA binding domain-containing protein [Alicyclobacillus dauci]WAH35505.1 NFACT family protein [Alicyclobacillus dauci]
MDGLTMRRLSLELAGSLTGSKIEKIYQPASTDLVLSLRGPGKSAQRLLISAHKQFARVHLLMDERPENPQEPPMFCMLLRKYIEGGRVVAVLQHGWDRVVEFRVEAVDEVGDIRTYFLICEVMGRHSNVILCRREDDDKLRIIDSIVRVTEQMSRYREVLPGVPYQSPPAQHKRSGREIEPTDLPSIDKTNWLARTNVQNLVDHVAGMGPVSAREILHRAAFEAQRQGDTPATSLVHAQLIHVLDAVEDGTESATVSLDSMGRATECAPFLLTHRQNYALCPSMSEGIRRRFADNGEVLYHSHLQDELRRVVDDHLDKLRGKRVKLEQSLEQSADESIYRLKAELLTAYAYQIEKGQERCILPNYYADNEPIAIELNPALDAIQNAQRYYKQATKRKRAATSVAEQLELVEFDIRYLDEVNEALRNTSLSNLEQIRRELISQGFLQEKQNKRKHKPTKPEKTDNRPDSYLSEDGFLIRVGRNNIQNDKLTFRQSEGHDVWLHVKDQPGSHVVIRKGVASGVPETTIEEAALLAAFFSRGRDSANVPVDITEIRHVWKPNGARPGLALYDHQRTLYVTPERALLEPILSRRSEHAPQA